MTAGLKSPRQQPEFGQKPGLGQESVWDYPRPPALRADSRRIEVRSGTGVIAESTGSYKVMETASPPTFYIPRTDVDFDLLQQLSDQTYCEWKGVASYWALAGETGLPVAWSYEQPRPRFLAIKDFIAFYPGRVECTLGGELVQPQAGGFYGGWITSEIIGPCKGDPGTGHW